MELPDWIPIDAWNGWLEMRKAKKIPTTDRAKVIAVNTLERLRKQGDDPEAVLDQSTFHGWQGLFPLKDRPVLTAAQRPAPAPEPVQSTKEGRERGLAELWAARGGKLRVVGQ